LHIIEQKTNHKRSFVVSDDKYFVRRKLTH
jgi:hypothetical protein